MVLFLFSLITAISCSFCLICMLCYFYYLCLIYLIILFMKILSALRLRVIILQGEFPLSSVRCLINYFHGMRFSFFFNERSYMRFCIATPTEGKHVTTHRPDRCLPKGDKTTLPRGGKLRELCFWFILMLRG